jgi:Helix-turn-helix domain
MLESMGNNEATGFTPADLAQYFKVDERTVRRWVLAGHIPGVGPFEATQHGGPGGRIFIHRQALINLIETALGRPWAVQEAKEYAAAERENQRLSAQHNAAVLAEAKALKEADSKHRATGAPSGVIFA